VEFLNEGKLAGEGKQVAPAGRPSPPAVGNLHLRSDNQYTISETNIRPTSSIVKALSTVSITPRPTKLGIATSRTHGACKRPPQVSDVSTETQGLQHSVQSTGIQDTPQWSREELPAEEYSTIQTRFIASVGWCIRYGSRVSQGGRYRILFLDGVVLDIDVDEGWVEFTSQEGDVTRHEIRNCSKRNIGERWKVFGDFVSLFDDDRG